MVALKWFGDAGWGKPAKRKNFKQGVISRAILWNKFDLLVRLSQVTNGKDIKAKPQSKLGKILSLITKEITFLRMPRIRKSIVKAKGNPVDRYV